MKAHFAYKILLPSRLARIILIVVRLTRRPI
jgi:hypothetical protein